MELCNCVITGFKSSFAIEHGGRSIGRRRGAMPFFGAALCALLSFACCLQSYAANYTCTLYSNDICYSNNVPRSLSGVLDNAIAPKGEYPFFDTVSQQDGMKTFTANPPKGHMVAEDGPGWVLINRIVGNNWRTTSLDVLMRNPANICMAYTNVGYSVTLDLAELIKTKKITSSCQFIDIAPCFEWLKYDLQYDKGLSNNIDVDSTITATDIIYTNTVTLASRPSDWSSESYSFKGLSLSSNATVASFQFGDTITSAGATFNAKTNGVDWTKNGVVTLYGVWTKRYKVYFNGNGGDSSEIGPTNYDYGVTWQLPFNSFTKANNEFVGWSTNQNASADEALLEGTSVSNLTDVPGGTIMFYAIWRSVVYHNAKFAWQNDDGETNVVVSVREGDCVEVPIDVDANALTGRSFVGWEPDPATTQIASNTVFTAHYTNNVYTITFDANGGEGGFVTNLEYNAAIPSAPEVTKEGWSFVAWEPEPAGTVPASNVTFMAQWSENIFYNVEFVYYDVGVVVTNRNRVKENDYVAVPADFKPEARIGYSFSGWDPPDPANTPITSDTEFAAQYTNNVYEVVFDADGGEGGITNYLDYASTIEPPMVTREGCSFVSWEPEPDETVPASNVCYVAQYTNNIYTVTFDANGGVGGLTTNLEYGAAMPQPPAVTREGFVFEGWIPEPAGTVPASNVCYVAQWTEEKITYGDLATAADANFELTWSMAAKCWSVSEEYASTNGTSIKAVSCQEPPYGTCITGVVHGVGKLSFKARSSKDLQYGNGLNQGLRLGYGSGSYPSNWMNPEPLTTTDDWTEFSVQLGEESKDTTVWWYVYQDVYQDEDSDFEVYPPFTIWIDEIKWTPMVGPTEEDRPVISGFSAASGGGFMLSISNASPSFDYVVQTNTTLRTDAGWGEIKRVSGDQAGSIELERPAGVPKLFYRVGVEAK